MKAIFKRIAPGIQGRTEPLAVGWFAISHRWFDSKKARREAYGRVYKIRTTHGTIYRNLRFSPRLKGSPKSASGQILLDWAGWLDISSVDADGDLILEITPANPIELFYHSGTHPDPAYRHSMAVARAGLYLGLISLILAFK